MSAEQPRERGTGSTTSSASNRKPSRRRTGPAVQHAALERGPGLAVHTQPEEKERALEGANGPDRPTSPNRAGAHQAEEHDAVLATGTRLIAEQEAARGCEPCRGRR